MAFIVKSNVTVSNLRVGPLSGGGIGGGGGGDISTAGLQLYWDIGNSTSYSGTGTAITDLSGNGNDGILTGTPTYSSAGASSYLDWAGDNTAFATYSSTLHQDTLNVNSANAITVSNWVTFTDMNSSFQNTYIGSCTNGDLTLRQGQVGSTNIENKFYFKAELYDSSYNDFNLGYTASNFPNSWQLYSQYGLSSSDFGNWFNMTVTIGSGYYSFFLNGVQQWSLSYATTSPYNGSTVTLDRYKFAFGGMLSQSDQSTRETWAGFSGKWGNSAVYNRVLSPTEIASNFDALKSRYGY